MGFLIPIITGIIGAIGSAASAVGGVASTVGGALGGVLNDVGSVVGSIASDVSATLSTAVTDAITALGGTANTIFNEISGVLGSAVQVETEVLGTIQQYVDEASTFVNDLNNNVIKPITDTVNITYGAITNLITELHTDLHGGIKGLLAIPDAIAGALTSVDAQLGRAMQELGLANKELVTSTLLPGLKDSLGEPLNKIATGPAGPTGSVGSIPDSFKEIQVPNCDSDTNLIEKLTGGHTTISTFAGYLGEFGKVLYTVMYYLPYLGMSIKADLRCQEQQVNKKQPYELLSIGDAIKALYRGILSAPEAEDEAIRQGIAPQRFAVLKELEQFLPSPSLALQMRYRGLIDQADLEAILKKQGFKPSDTTAIQGAFLEPVNPREAIALAAREQAFAANFLPAAGAQPVPSEAEKMYEPRFHSTAQAKWDWMAHWKIPGPEWWFTAWARGLRTKEEFRLAAQADNVPPDVIDDLIPVFQETVQLWMIPDMLATGIMNDAEALAYLHYIGMGDNDAALIMKYGRAKQKAPAAAQAADLAGLSVAQAKTMYDEGIVDQAQYGELLAAHGYGADAIKLTIALADQEQQLAAIKQQNADLVNEVNAGTLSSADAVSAMYQDGYTTAQVDAVVLKFKAAKSANSKAVSATELDAMRVDGIIDVGIWKDGYANLGYAPLWIDRLDALFLTKHPGVSDVPSVIQASLGNSSAGG